MQFKIQNRVLYLILFLWFKLCSAQTNVVKKFSVNDGLPSNKIYAVLKDSRGILWTGTDKGISKIQNNFVTNYTEDNGIAYNNCWAITEDTTNNLWFGSYGGGITHFDGKKFTAINTSNGLINNYIRKLFVYKNFLYVGTKAGVSIINTKNKKIINSKINIPLQVMGFFEYQKNIYIQTYRKGFWKHDTINDSLLNITPLPENVFSVFNKKDTIYVSFDGFTHKNKSIKKYAIKDYLAHKNSDKQFGNSVFWDFISDKQGDIYGVADGINYPSGGTFKISNDVIKNQKKEFQIKSTKNWSVNYDQLYNQLYVGTLDNGLYKIDLDEKVMFYEAIKNIIALKNIKNTNYFLTDDKLIIKSLRTEKTITKEEFYGKIKSFFSSEKINKNPKRSIHRFVNDKIIDLEFISMKVFNGNVWINTTIGLFKINSQDYSINYYANYSGEYFILEDNSGYFQIPYKGVDFFKNILSQNQKDVYERHLSNTPKNTSSIQKIGNTLFFMSEYSGLYTLEKGKFTSYIHNDIWKEKELIKATTNKQNQLIVANSKGDVFVLNVLNDFNIAEKVRNNQIKGNTITILDTYKDYIVIGTEKGVNFYKDNTNILLDQHLGVKEKVLTSAVIKNDTLIAGSKNGYYKIDLKKVILENPKSYHLNISNIKVNYKDVSDKDFNWFKYNSNKISLPYDKNNISLSFYAENHPYPEKLEYRYRIKGLDKNSWSKWSTDTQINFTYLSNGTYPIIVNVKDYYTGKNYTQELIRLKITPPYWKTSWFWVIIILCIITISYFQIKQKIKKSLQQEALQKRIAETKLEALQSQMNPHFTFNAMSSIQNYVIDNDIDKALIYIGEFSNLMRQTLDNSSETYISLREEIEYLNSYILLENMRFDNSIVVSIQTNGLSVDDEFIPPMLLQPLIENSFNHAFSSTNGKHKLTINFNKNNGFLSITVSDNGSGIQNANKQMQHTSKALKIIKERLNLISKNTDTGFITIKSSNKGTVTTIIIPK